jgi:maleate cis-trans isomerase
MASRSKPAGHYAGEIVGHRARIGYSSVGFVTELLPKYFYRIVPEGVTLALLTFQITDWDRPGMDRNHDAGIAAAESFARAGCDLIVLGGVPVNTVRGFGAFEDFMAQLEDRLGVPVTSSYRAQVNAYKALGARKVATVHPFLPTQDARFDDMMRRFGMQLAGCKGVGGNLIELPLIPKGAALQCARELMAEHPEADTIFFPNPHWSVMDDIAAIESELKVNVIASLQAIIWEALRKSGIDDRIDGFGRLLREY